MSQDQWRRKTPVLPLKEVRAPHLIIPIFSESLLLCYNCRTPCKPCCEEMWKTLPPELHTALALRDFAEIHGEHSQGKSFITSNSRSSLSFNFCFNFN